MRASVGLGSDRAARSVTGLLGAMAILGLAAAVATVWPFTVDDTFITLRYSRNVAEGIGPTFNATGPRAEGYTTFLWMMVLSIPHVLRLDAVAVAKSLGVAAAFATLLVSARWAWAEAASDRAFGSLELRTCWRTEDFKAFGRIARRDDEECWRHFEEEQRRETVESRRKPTGANMFGAPDAGGGRRWAAAIAVACLAAIPATAVHAVSGMETALFALLVTGMFAEAAEQVRGNARPPLRLAILALLSGLTRPEGNLAAFVVLAMTTALVTRQRRRRVVREALLLWVLPLFAYEIWRRAYYGLSFPLPFYVKLASPGRLPGWPDVLAWLESPVLHFALLFAPALVRPPRSLWPALAATAALAVFFVLPQHQMGYDHRYLAPLDPTVCVLAGVGLARALARTARAPRFARIGAVTAAVVVSAGLEVENARAVLLGEAAYGDGLVRAHERLGRQLFGLGLPGARLAISDAGAVPYFSQWWTLDLVGLNDASIATTGRHDPDRLLDARPDVVVLFSEYAERFEPWDWNAWEAPLYAACLDRGFVRVDLRRFASDYWLWVMARPGSIAERGLTGTASALAGTRE